MSGQEKNMTRRRFIRAGLQGAGLVGLGSTIGVVASRFLPQGADETSWSVGNTAMSDLKDYSSVDPALIQYEEIDRVETTLQSLRAIAVGPDDRIYIAGDEQISVFGRDLDLLSHIQLNGRPRCLTVTEDNRVYVGMKDHFAAFNDKGVQETSWYVLGSNTVLTSIAVYKDDMFVADAGNREILRFSTSGRFLRRIGKKNKTRNIPGFVVPSPYFDLTVAPDGLLKVANPGRHRVEAYTFDGDFELAWGEASMGITGFCGCCNPVNFALLPDGAFVTSEKGLPRIKVYNADGTFKGVVAAPEQFEENDKACCGSGEITPPLADVSNCQTGGIDVAADSQGRVLALDPVEQVVRVFGPIQDM